MSEYKQYICEDCDFIYDEALGDPESGIVPGTLWKDVPEDWLCPECGAPKAEFTIQEVVF